MGFDLAPDKKPSFQQRSRCGLSHSLEIDANSSDAAANSTSGKTNSVKKLLPRRARSESWSFSSRRRGDRGISVDRAVESSSNESAARNVCDDHHVDNATSRKTALKVNASARESALPSQSSLDDLHRVLHLIESERHLVAYELYTDVKKRLDYWREQMEAGADTEEKVQAKAVGTRTYSERSRNHHEKSVHRGRKKMNWKTAHRNDVRENNEHEIIHDPSENKEAYKFMMRRIKEFETLEKRATMFHTAKQNLDTPTSWTLSQTLFGITTHYRRESDNTLSVKIEGELHGIPLFEQMVVLRECDLYHTWAPFCNESRKLAQLDKLDVVAWYSVGSPLLGMVRDACYRAVGCDCMREDGSVLLVAVGLGDEDTNTKDYSGGVSDTENDQNQQLTQHQQDNDDPSSEQKRQNYQNRRSVTFQESESSSPVLNTSATSFLARDAILSTIALPPVPNGLGHGRMTIRNFSASIEILSASSARTKMVVNIDPNLHFLPQSLIDFCMKRMCGVMLARLQVAATKVVKDPIKNPHSRRMREDVRFYRDWLLPKFRTYCDELGWDMPPVKAFEVSEEDLKAEQIFEGWRSADMLDCQDNTQDLTLSPIQQYQHVDNATTLGAGECTHRRCQSESSLDSKSRLRNWGLLKQFLPESFLKHQSSGLDRDDCTPLRSSQSATSTTPEGRRMRDRRRLFFYDNEHRRPQTKEEEATSDRELAALRLKPEPFSESKALRLKELKDAKARAEERLKRSEHRGSLAGCDVSSVRSDFPTTPRGPASISSVAELEAFGAWNRDATIFIVSLMLNVALVPLQSYALTTSTLPPRVNLSNSAWVDVITRILLSLLMIALHATSLWATMNTFLVIAFDTIDFGQKHLAKNLGHGKRLYVTAVKKYSKIVSVAVAAISLCLGFVAAFLQNAVVTMCTKFNTERSLPSLNHSWGTLVHFFPSKYAWVFHRASYWISLVQNSCMMAISFLDIVADRIHLPAVLHCASRIASWIMTKVSSIIPSLLKRSGSSMLCFLIKTLPNALVSHLNVCEINFVTTSWRYQSVKISSFITSRLGMFLLALLFMSYILLPKPERKLCQTEVVKDANALINAQLIGEVKDDDSLSDVSARTGVSRGKHNFLTLSSGSVPMEVIEE